MNYVIVVVAIVLVMMVCAWFAEGRRTFTGVRNSLAVRCILIRLQQPKNIEALLLQSRIAAQVARKAA